MFGKRTLVPDSPDALARTFGAATPGRTTLVQQIAQPEDAAAGVSGSEQVHAAAAHGMSGAGQALPHLDRIQAMFGRHDVSGVRAHVGGAAAEGATATYVYRCGANGAEPLLSWGALPGFGVRALAVAAVAWLAVWLVVRGVMSRWR